MNVVKSTSARLEDLCKIESNNMSETWIRIRPPRMYIFIPFSREHRDNGIVYRDNGIVYLPIL